MNQIKIFTLLDQEHKVNEWLENNNNIEVIDIKFHTDDGYKYVLIHYKLKDE